MCVCLCCLRSCIGSLDRAGGVTGRLCKQTMLKMYKTKQWMEPSPNYVSKGLDPGLVALSQMVSTSRRPALKTCQKGWGTGKAERVTQTRFLFLQI